MELRKDSRYILQIKLIILFLTYRLYWRILFYAF